jgi:uncharacterized protein (TIGR03000 family)
MRRILLRGAAGVAMIALAVLVAGVSEAKAGWGSRGGYYGSGGGSSGGSWGSSGGSWASWGSSGGSWGSYGSWGSSGGYAYSYSSRGGLYHGSHGRRHRVVVHHHGSWGSSGGSWGSSGGSWGSSGGSSGVSSGGVIYYDSAPAVQAPTSGSEVPGPAGTPPPPPAGGETSLDSRSVMIEVSAPADAKVFVNGKPTTSTGDFRRFVSRNLNTGYRYAYSVRAEAVRNGKTVQETRMVDVRPGQRAAVAFDLVASETPETSLTLNVPEDAKVTLGGAETSATGATRVYSTKALADGEEWSNYTIVATIERDGRTLTKEQSITLKAGDSQSVSIDFDETKVAAKE